MKLRILLFGMVLFLLINCDSRDDLCDSILPSPPTTVFMLIDSTTGEALIGQNKIYDPVSLNALNTYPPFRIDQNQDTVVELSFGGVVSGSHLLFKLSETEVDTIRIEYIIRETECFNIRDLERFYYNDELIEPNNGLHTIRK